MIKNFYPHFSVAQNSQIEPHSLYELGKAIKPTHRIPTNGPKGHYSSINRAARKWCFIDLLLTCESIAEAVAKTHEREETFLIAQ